MRRIRRFIDYSKGNFSNEEHTVIVEALRLAYKMLADRRRYNNEPYILHSLGVADIVMRDMRLDHTTIVAALLHDVARFQLKSVAELSNIFGELVGEVLLGMNNISDVHTNMSNDQAERFKDMIISYSTNPRVILLKVADRTEVMRSLEHFPPAKRAKKSWESLYIYSQIAHKLGYYALKSEMEDLALRYLETEDYNSIQASLEATAKEREKFIAQFIAPIEEQLVSRGLKFKIKGRTKSIYSIWRKMTTNNIPFEDVFDVFAVRIIIDCEPSEEKAQCWYAFSVVTDHYKPNPKRMRDWISIPKSNGYESLHTTVVTGEGRWVEVQIRTTRMDETAENGAAAHWRYKGVESGEHDMQQWLEKLRSMVEGVDVAKGENLNLDNNLSLKSKEVFVFTPTGDLRKLRGGATILDFAYDIHGDIGNRCIAGKINHKTATIRDRLQSGDLVEIITSKNQTPRADWLNIVVTSKARSAIKSFLREAEQKEFQAGKESLERKLKNWKLGLDLDIAVVTLCKYFKLKNGVDLYRKLALEDIPMSDVKQVLQRYVSGELSAARIPETPQNDKPKGECRGSDTEMLVVGENVRGIDYRFAQCCSPIYGDDIFGFVTILNGITIHKRSCANAKDMIERHPYRVIDATWKSCEKVGKREVMIEMVARGSVTATDIQEIAQHIGIELRSITNEFVKDKTLVTLKLNVAEGTNIDGLIYMLKQIDVVEKIKKGSNNSF